jgi:hypothetical protein
LINETAFPGERGYQSEENSLAAMEALAQVLEGRLRRIPPKYTQRQIAGTRSNDIIDIITVGGVKGQFDGFYRDQSGQPSMVDRVDDRVANLLRVANQGAPGRFARMLTHATQLAEDLVVDDISCADRHAAVTSVEGVPATGHAYSWMTDMDRFHPGGNFLRIPDDQWGTLGGNRFFTLRADPR